MAIKTTRTFNRRDSATSLLKSLGVDKKDYDKFIKVSGNTFVIAMDGDKAISVDDAKKPVTPAKKKSEPAPVLDPKPTEKAKTDDAFGGEARVRGAKVKKPAAKKEGKKASAKGERGVRPESIAGVVLELCKAGKSNAEVWEVLQKKFGCGDDHKHYPGWYRSHLKRRGLLK